MTTCLPPDNPTLNQIPIKVRHLPLLTFIVFEQVLRTQSFTRAAEQLGISKSTVSKHVVRLEEVVGRTLVLREPAVPTTAGEAVREIARQVAAQARQLAASVEQPR